MAMIAPILFIHGFPLDAAMWRHQSGIAPDLWGAGNATIPASAPECSIAEHAARLVELLDARRERQIVICGLSMGGYIAFEMLRSFPERVRAAILCNTKAEADTPDAKRARDEMAATAAREGMGPIARALVPRMLARSTLEHRSALVREVTAMIERQPVQGVVRALRALRDRRDSTPVLREIRVPVLVIAGDDDQITPAAGMEKMASAIPAAEFELIKNAGHLSPLEQPRLVNAAVDRFVAGL